MLLSYAAGRSEGAGRRLLHLAGQPAGHHFQVTVIAQGGRVERPTSSIDLFFGDGNASARASCNWLGFRWKIEHGQLVARHWATTLVNCGGKLLKYDRGIMRFLRARPTVVVRGATLVLRTPTLEWRGTRLD
jgi:heat shock protein HslJ